MPSATVDAVVIGSGPNGLAAGITLARHGWSVLVLEAADRAGGAVATEELTLPGFHHDVFSAVYPAAAASPVFRELPLERHGLRWVHPRYCYAHALDGGRAAALARDVDETAATLDALHAGDGAAWARFARPYLRAFGALRRTMLGAFPPVRGAVELAGRLGPAGTLDFARLVLMAAHSLARDLFGGGGARAPVREVTVERGRVTGVALEGGERLAARAVVADVTPHGLLALAGPALGGRYADGLRRYRYGPGTLKADWALSGPIPWSAPECREAGTVHVGGDEHEVLRAVAPAGDGLAERPFLLCGQQSVADPTRAPAGQHTAWAYTHGPHGADWEGDRDRHVERVEAQVERFAPGFRERILARHVLTPGDLQRRNRNLVLGDVGAGSYTLDQVVFRPVPSLMPYRTPVRGLYLGSAATFPGGAVHGVPGHAAARQALAERRLRI